MARRSRPFGGRISGVDPTRALDVHDLPAQIARVGSPSVAVRVDRIRTEIASIIDSSPTQKELLAFYAALSTCLVEINAAFIGALLVAKEQRTPQLLTTAQAAKILGQSERWLYRQAHRLTSARHPSPGRLMFDRDELLKEFKVGPR